MDRARVSEADIMIAYVGVPSFGVGLEIEFARQAGTKVILLYAESDTVSRLPRGNPAVVHEIVLSDFNQALGKLDKYLTSLQ